MKATKYGNRYQITYRCPGFPRIINEYFDTLEEAELRISCIKLEKKRGTLTPPAQYLDSRSDPALLREKMTVSMLMQEYLTMYGLNHWSESTLSCNRHRINDYIIPYIGDSTLKSITTHRLEQFYQDLLTRPAVVMKGREGEKRTVSFDVVEKCHSILRSALNQAIRWDYLRGANPAMAVELPRTKKKQREAWTAEEVKQALSLCEDPALKLCMYLAMGCSMRIGEILGLTWDCVHMEQALLDSDDAYLQVNKELRRADKRSLEELHQRNRDNVYQVFPNWKLKPVTTLLVLKAPKTESSVRTIYLPRSVAQLLLEEQQRQAGWKAEGHYQDYDLVVAQETGRPYETHMIRQKFEALIQEHHLRRVVFHSLRHSSTSVKLRLSGGDIKSVQGDTGHAQSNMVTDVYSHIMNEDRKRLGREMEHAFFQGERKKAAPSAPTGSAAEKLIELLETAPELAQPLLKLSQVLAESRSGE